MPWGPEERKPEAGLPRWGGKVRKRLERTRSAGAQTQAWEQGTRAQRVGHVWRGRLLTLPVVGVLAPARPSVTWGGCQGQAWAVGAHGPQSGRRSRSAASQRRRRRAASAPGTGHAPVCAPAGSLRAPLPGAALAPQCCWGLAGRGEVSTGSWPGTDPSPDLVYTTCRSPRIGAGGRVVLPGPLPRASGEVVRYRKEEGPPWALGPPAQAHSHLRALARTAIRVCRQAGPLFQGLLLPVPAAVAAVVVVRRLAGWRTVQGSSAEMGHVGALWCQRGDGALHGTGIWGRLQGHGQCGLRVGPGGGWDSRKQP